MVLGALKVIRPLAHGNFAVPAKFMGCKPVGQTILVKITP
jgi:hypothetical protein